MLAIPIPEKRSKWEAAFPVYVLLSCCLTVYEYLSSYDFLGSLSYVSNILRLSVSLLGLAAVSFYVLKKPVYGLLFVIWTAVQIPFIFHTHHNPESNFYFTSPVYYVAQGIDIKIHLTLQGGNNALIIGVNLMAIIFYPIARIIYLAAYYDKEIRIRPYRDDSFLNEFLPSGAVIDRRVTLSGKRDWLLIRLLNDAIPESEKHALIRPKHGRFAIGRNIQVYYRPVQDISMIKKKGNREEDFPIGDWAIVE